MQDAIRHFPEKHGVVRIALMRGDEELSRTLVVPMTLQLGRARLRMDGIGGVETPEEHRNKGYSRRVLEAAVQTMTAGEAVLSTLYGIPHFYPKYGFATLGPEYVITPRSVHERNVLRDGVTARPAVPGDLPAIQRLYRDETEGSYGAVVRDDDWWSWEAIARRLTPGADEARVVERGGRVVGYALRGSFGWWMSDWTEREPRGLKLGEAFAADPDAADIVLAASRRWATDVGEDSVGLAIPPWCRVGTAARLQNCTVAESWSDEAEFMGRSIGLVALARAMAPELDARWRSLSCSMPPFTVTIVTEGERVTISGGDGGIVVDPGAPGDIEVALDPGTVARLALGGFEPEVILRRAGVAERAIPMLSTLFPRHVPYIYPVDRF